MSTTELGQYILDLLDRQNLSMREGSLKSGLDPTTISQMLRRGKTNTPRPDTLRMLAGGLGGSYEHMMRLAGHLPPKGNDNHIPAEERARIDHIIKVWREVAELDPDSLGILLNIVEGQAEMAKALLKAGKRLVQEENNQTATM